MHLNNAFLFAAQHFMQITDRLSMIHHRKSNTSYLESVCTVTRCWGLVQKANPQATQWIERILKLSVNIGKLLKKHFTSVPVKDWCMLPHGIDCRTPDQSSWNSGICFNWPDPQNHNNAKFRCTLTDSVHSRYPMLKILPPSKKVGKTIKFWGVSVDWPNP